MTDLMPESAPDCQTCPRRAENPQQPDPGPHPDRWFAGDTHWRGADGDYFPDGQAMPRTCSYCGSVHPEDALALLAAGWTDERAIGKGYKAYLHPPGWVEAHAQAIAQMDAGVRPCDALREIVRDPLPPAKLYTQHMNASQVAELNAFVRSKGKR